MKFVIQRVNHASVTVDGQTVGSIGKGLLILFGAGKGDTEEMLPKFVDKITKLRIFSDENDKINLSLLDVGGEHVNHLAKLEHKGDLPMKFVAICFIKLWKFWMDIPK